MSTTSDWQATVADLGPIPVECLRCGATVEQRFPGLCAGCTGELHARFDGTPATDDAIDTTYVPKMNVTVNAVALKDD